MNGVSPTRPLPAAATSSPTVERLSLPDALRMGPEAWDALCGRMAHQSPFVSWAWHAAWVSAAPAEEIASSEVLLMRDTAGRVSAILPVGVRPYRFRRLPLQALTWAIGDVGCPDHLDVIADPATNLGPLLDALLALDWRVLALGNLAAEAPGGRQLAAAARAQGLYVIERPLHQCHYLRLPHSWDSYVASRSPRTRNNIRKYDRRVFETMGATLSHYGEPARVAEGLRILIDLHERRWEGQGSFGTSPRFTRMLTEFARAIAPSGHLHLTAMSIAGEPVAADLTLQYGGRRFGYVSGRDPKWDREGVGRVLMARLIRAGIECGDDELDFMRGDEGYKDKWGTEIRSTTELLIIRRSVPGWLLVHLDRLGEWHARRRKGARRGCEPRDLEPRAA